jgi:thiamine-monophosphate kinase
MGCPPDSPAKSRRRGPAQESLQALGEDGLIRMLTRGWPRHPDVETGVGDDCAVLRWPGDRRRLLFKTDAVVENVHFLPTTPPALVGRKALARVLSDFAAMAGEPWCAVITLGLPPTSSPPRIRAIYRGLEALARRHEVRLVGGETTRARQLWIAVAALGYCLRPVLRSTARPKDLLWVTGRLGGSRAGHHLRFQPRLAEAQWLARHGLPTAMMDLSDGLGRDLPRLERASGVKAFLDHAALPRRRGASLRQALHDGEDYELLFTTRPTARERLLREWPFRLALTAIGVLRPREPMQSSFTSCPNDGSGFDHFSKR